MAEITDNLTLIQGILSVWSVNLERICLLCAKGKKVSIRELYLGYNKSSLETFFLVNLDTTVKMWILLGYKSHLLLHTLRT